MSFEKEFYGVQELSRLLGVSEWSLRGWIRTGRLRAMKAGSRVLITRGEIEQFLKPRRVSHQSSHGGADE